MSETATKTYGPIGESSATPTDAAYAGATLLVVAGGLFGPLPFEAVVVILLGIIAIQHV